MQIMTELLNCSKFCLSRFYHISVLLFVKIGLFWPWSVSVWCCNTVRLLWHRRLERNGHVFVRSQRTHNWTKKQKNRNTRLIYFSFSQLMYFRRFQIISKKFIQNHTIFVEKLKMYYDTKHLKFRTQTSRNRVG